MTTINSSILRDADAFRAFLNGPGMEALRVGMIRGFRAGAIFRALDQLRKLELSLEDSLALSDKNVAAIVDMLVPADYSQAAHVEALARCAELRAGGMEAGDARVVSGENKISQLRIKVSRAFRFGPHIVDILETMFVDGEPLVTNPAKTIERILCACATHVAEMRTAKRKVTLDSLRATARAAVAQALAKARPADPLAEEAATGLVRSGHATGASSASWAP